MPHDVVVARIAHGCSALDSPRPIDIDQDGDAPYAPLHEDLLDIPHQPPSDSFAPPAGMHDQAVHVAPPSIKRPKQRADDLALDHRKNKSCRRIGDDSTEFIHPIGWFHTGT